MIRASFAEHPLLWRGLMLSASAALGSALPDILSFAHQVLS